MRKWYETLKAVEYAFIVFIIAAFSVVGVAGLLFGRQLGKWAEWQAGIVLTAALIAGAFGAIFGWRLAFDSEPLRLINRTSRSAERHKKW